MTTPPISAQFPSWIASLAMEAAKTAETIEKLPAVRYPDDGVIVPLLQQAGVESFFVNVRGLIEFLAIRPATRDRAASDLLPSWTPVVDAPTHARLEQCWLTASQHLMHFGQVRTKQEDGTVTVVDVEKAALEAIADDVLAVWDQFAEQVGQADLMVKWAIRKRGSFIIWNTDGTLQSH
jgi:hypothetical protein